MLPEIFPTSRLSNWFIVDPVAVLLIVANVFALPINVAQSPDDELIKGLDIFPTFKLLNSSIVELAAPIIDFSFALPITTAQPLFEELCNFAPSAISLISIPLNRQILLLLPFNVYSEYPEPITAASELPVAFNSPDIPAFSPIPIFKLLNSSIVELAAPIIDFSFALPITTAQPLFEELCNFAPSAISLISIPLNRQILLLLPFNVYSEYPEPITAASELPVAFNSPDIPAFSPIPIFKLLNSSIVEFVAF